MAVGHRKQPLTRCRVQRRLRVDNRPTSRRRRGWGSPGRAAAPSTRNQRKRPVNAGRFFFQERPELFTISGCNFSLTWRIFHYVAPDLEEGGAGCHVLKSPSLNLLIGSPPIASQFFSPVQPVQQSAISSNRVVGGPLTYVDAPTSPTEGAPVSRARKRVSCSSRPCATKLGKRADQSID